MRIKPKTVTRQVKLMRNPQPVAMALVDQGAAQVPFAVVKHDNVTTNQKDEGTDPMALKTLKIRTGKGAQRQSAVTKMQFSKTQFPTEAAVKSYLDSKDIEGFGDIADGNDVWIVPTLEDLTGQIVGKAASTPGRDTGVTVFVAELSVDATTTTKGEVPANPAGQNEHPAIVGGNGTTDAAPESSSSQPQVKPKPKGGVTDDNGGGLADGTQDNMTSYDDNTSKKRASSVSIVYIDEDGVPTKKGILTDFPALSQKYDYWGAYMCGEKTLKEVIEAGSDYDGLVPGVDEVLDAYSITIGNILMDDDMDPTTKAGLVAQAGADSSKIVMDLYTLFEDVGDVAMKSTKRSVREAARKFTDGFIETVSGLSGDNVITTTTTKAAGTPPVQVAVAPVADNAVMKAIGNITNLVQGVITRIDGQDTAIKALSDGLSRSTQRKSMSSALDDLVDQEAVDPVEAARKQEARESTMRALGGRPRAL